MVVAPSFRTRVVGSMVTPTDLNTVMVKVRLAVSLASLFVSVSETVQVSVTAGAAMVGVPVTARLA